MLEKISSAIVLSTLISFSAGAQCTAVDQSQLNYNGGMSARNLAQYTVWQDFTPGSTGTLCKLDIGFFNAMTGTGTLNIFAGTGTSGTLLQTQSVTVSGTGNFFQTFTVSAPVTAGSVYTFQFIPTLGGGLPDPYGVQVESPGTYAGGQMEITDPSGTYNTGYDMVFKTYVDVSTGIYSPENNINSISVAPNPFSSFTVLKTTFACKNAKLIIRNMLGQTVKTMENMNGNEFILTSEQLQAGIYSISLIENNGTIADKKLVIADK